MAEINDVQALEKISTAVDESQIKIILSSQCIKAQAFLFDKLRKQSERQKEVCNYINNSNMKLEMEIKLAEQEIKSLNLAIETIKHGNIELKTEYLLSKERKEEIFERTIAGKNKYENLWEKSKKRYESIPCVQQMIQIENKSQSIKANINNLINEAKTLINDIKMKNNYLIDIDRARVVQLAKFFVHERPKALQIINEKQNKIMEVSKEVEMLLKDQAENGNYSNKPNECFLAQQHNFQPIDTIKDSSVEDNNWSNLSKSIDKDTLVLPSLHIQNNDLDILSIKLDQIKKVDLQQNITSMKRSVSSDLEINSHKKYKTEEHCGKIGTSPYFDLEFNINSINNDKMKGSKKYSEKKLIHILEDIKLNKSDAYKIIKELEPDQFLETNYITTKCKDKSDNSTKCQEKDTLGIVEIEEIDLTIKKNEDDVVIPPSQFLDITQSTQEKKTVQFNITNEEQDSVNPKGGEIKESQEKTLKTSTNDDTCTTIKDMILRKHNLDLSPQFVYGKNTLMQKQNEDITSKFFDKKEAICFQYNKSDNNNNKNIKQKQTANLEENANNHIIQHPANSNNIVVSSPKAQLEVTNMDAPVAGFLFKHGPQGIPDTLNVSISTTGFDDSEDFPHCIDSSILLSPKADLPTPVANSGNNEVFSQEVPNFLAGFRKAGLSFFGSTSSGDPKPDTSAQNQRSGFNFTFGNEEKKGRGGLFSMFR